MSSFQTDKHKAIYRQVIAAVNSGDTAALDAFLAADLVDHNPIPDQGPGRDGFKEWMRSARTSFPDMSGTIERILAEDDLLAAHVVWRGNQRGTFVGVAPTNQFVVLPAFHIVRFSGDRIVEWSGAADLLGALLQLGARVIAFPE